MTPDEIAKASAQAMWANDRTAHGLGMELLEIGPGKATMSMVVREDMMNGHDLAHGGLIFTLADTAFAYACNSFGPSTVAGQCQITYLRPGKLGDRLMATARVINQAGRTGLTDVTVTAGDGVVAEFRGYSRTIGGSLIDLPGRNNG